LPTLPQPQETGNGRITAAERWSGSAIALDMPEVSPYQYQKGGVATLLVDGKQVGQGPVAITAAMIFSYDDGATCRTGRCLYRHRTLNVWFHTTWAFRPHLNRGQTKAADEDG
jgi:hypothetical protein